MNKMIKIEKDLYPIIEQYLITHKKCIPEYTGNELHMGTHRKMRADVYGYSRINNEKFIYLLEGKHYLDGRKNFSKVLCEAIPLLEFADYVYIFGIGDTDFESNNKKYCEICRLLGIGILIINEEEKIKEILSPKKNILSELDRKEILFRIFFKNVKAKIAELILQATFEYILLTDNDEGCVPFIEVYNKLFSKKGFKNRLKQILTSDYSLNDISMRKAFQNKYGNSEFT